MFDPRATALAVLRRDGTVAVAAALDPHDPSGRRSSRARSPTRASPVRSRSCSRRRSGTIPAISLSRTEAATWSRSGSRPPPCPESKGRSWSQLKGRDRITGPQLGYGLDYTLKIGTHRSFHVRTRPVPTVLDSRSFAHGPGFTGADRQDS